MLVSNSANVHHDSGKVECKFYFLLRPTTRGGVKGAVRDFPRSATAYQIVVSFVEFYTSTSV